MPAASRHAKPKTPDIRLRALVAAAATLVGVAAAFVFLHGGSATPGPSRQPIAVTSAGSGLADNQVSAAVHHDVAALETRTAQRASTTARHRHLAALAAARLAKQQAARRAAAQPTPSPVVTPAATPTPVPSSGGGDAASSPLGVCIRDAEEGGSYAWGPGNGGGAYQFLLGTWEHYGGAASEYGTAGPAYQDQIFDNAIAAGGASNWTDYDGC
jgi:hypothetical protein